MSENIQETTLINHEMDEPTMILSSTATLFWRIFAPVFSTVLLTGLLLAFWLIDEDDLYLSYPALWLRIGITAAWLLWITLMYRTLWRLRRVDVNSTHFFVTDYWTTVRYPWSAVEKMGESKRLGRRVAHWHLRISGRFGTKISFLPANHYDRWLAENTKNNNHVHS
jgi:hypothetical protein